MTPDRNPVASPLQPVVDLSMRSVMGPKTQADALGLTDEMRLAVLDNLSDGVYFVDRHRRIQYWNKGAERLTGFTAEEVIGSSCRDGILNHCNEAGRQLCGKGCPLAATMRDGEQREGHVYLHHKDGHRHPVHVKSAPIHDPDGKVIGAAEIFRDDSALVESRQSEADLRRATLLDPLTGIGNRSLGEAVLTGMLEQNRRFGRRFGVLFVDIDHFKTVNDRFGHDVGDEALRVVARTLLHTLRRGDDVVRWGGEEFVVLLADSDDRVVAAVANRLCALVKRARLRVDGKFVRLTISVGATLARHDDTPQSILRRADELLYLGKSSGRDRVMLDVS